MQHQTHTIESRHLGRTMTHETYGHGGQVMLAFPPQNGHYRDFASFGMVETVRPWIEAGKLTVVCVDAIDEETWCGAGSEHPRIALHERWVDYIVRELVPAVTPAGQKPMTCGCSMGAMHAGNLMLRRPDVFGGCVCMSGVYHADYFFPYYTDPRIFGNSPQDFLPGLPPNHKDLELMRQASMVFCVGQGAWEDDLLASTRELDRICAEKGIPAWFDYWGHDVNHDWPWWQKQFPYFVQNLLGEAC